MSKKNKNTLVYKAKELLITDNRKYLKCNWSGFTQSLISTLANTTKVKLTLETYPLFKESLKSLFASFCFNQIKTNKKLTLCSNIKSIYSIEPYLIINVDNWYLNLECQTTVCPLKLAALIAFHRISVFAHIAQ